MTFEELLQFVDIEPQDNKRVMAVFKTLYPSLVALWKSYPASLEGRKMTNMEGLLCLATSLHLIQTMQDMLDPSGSKQTPDEEFPFYTLN